MKVNWNANHKDVSVKADRPQNADEFEMMQNKTLVYTAYCMPVYFS